MLKQVCWMPAAFLLCAGCASPSALFQPAPPLVNLARLPGTTVAVSSAEEGFDAGVLIDGAVSAEEWTPDVGWEAHFEGALERRRRFNVEVDANAASEPFEWQGLRRNYRLGKEYAALGWVMIRFDQPRKTSRVILHSVDTEQYPATQFGLRDVLIQYWDEEKSLWVDAAEARGSSSAQLAVSFKPVTTQYLRAAALWTNGSKKLQTFKTFGRQETYAAGAIRLLEIEAYGVAPKKGSHQPWIR